MIALSSFGYVVHHAKEKVDIHISSEIQQAISAYINENKDIGLHFW
jgi:hypothetical protein